MKVITERGAGLPVLASSFPLAICFAHGSVYMSLLLCQFNPPSSPGHYVHKSVQLKVLLDAYSANRGSHWLKSFWAG